MTGGGLRYGGGARGGGPGPAPVCAVGRAVVPERDYIPAYIFLTMRPQSGRS
jgi:hypothetical protein